MAAGPLLGSSPNRGLPRLLIVPATVGLVITVATRFVFPQVRGSGVNQTKAALYIHNGYISFRTVIGKFLSRLWPLAEVILLGLKTPPFRSVPASPPWQPSHRHVPREAANLRSYRCGSWSCRRLQRPYLSHPLRHRRGHRALECRSPWIDRPLRGIERRHRTLVLGCVADVPHPASHVARSARTRRLRGSWSWRRRSRAALRQSLEKISGQDCVVSQRGRRCCTPPPPAHGRCDRIFRLSSGDGRGVSGHRSGHARTVCLEDAPRFGAAQDHRDYAFILERHSRGMPPLHWFPFERLSPKRLTPNCCYWSG